MKKTMIGVVPLWDDDKQSLWMLPDYMDCVEKSGGIPIILPLTNELDAISQMAEAFDGFLFTGGQDVAPTLYGEEALETCGDTCPARDAMEARLIEEAVLHRNKPALCVCRGIQILNVILGGTLYQDLPDQTPDSCVRHRQEPPYDQPVHDVRLVTGSPLWTLLNKDRIAVNSCHHQGIKALSGRLCPMAVADDGLAEAAYMPDKAFVWAVQWHPEYLYEAGNSAQLFIKFILACRREAHI